MMRNLSTRFLILISLASFSLLLACAAGGDAVSINPEDPAAGMSSLDSTQNTNLNAANGPGYNPGNEAFGEGNMVKMVVGIIPPEGKEPFGCFADSEEAAKPTLSVQFGESEAGPWSPPAEHRVESCVLTMVSYFCKMEGGAEKTFVKLSAEYGFEGVTYSSPEAVSLCPKNASLQLQNFIPIQKVTPPIEPRTSVPIPPDPLTIPAWQLNSTPSQ